MAPLLLAVVAAARGDLRGEAIRSVQEALAAMAQTRDWAALAGALKRILAGERDPQALAQGLDPIDLQALALVLAALEDERGWEALRRLAAAAGARHE